MEKQKRERNVNFTQEETNLLISLAAAKKQIIENKKSDATTWQEKEKAWMDIEDAFNSTSGCVFRNHKNLKLKYEALKRDTRKKIVQAERYKTAPPLTPAEEKVKEMIFFSVEGDESEFDPDLVMSNASTSNSAITWAPAEELNDQPAILTDDSCENIVIKIEEQDIEPMKENLFVETQQETLLQSKPKRKRPFKNLIEEKLEITKIQRKLITEELEHKQLQRKLLEKELEHKEIIYELEKQHLHLKIKLLKKELEEK